jgi:hypothetical protein
MTTSAARITVGHQDQSYGPYSMHEVNSLLASGRLDCEDLAWVEGTPDWVSLRTVPGVLAVPPLPPQASRDDYDPDCSDRKILPAFLMAFFIGPLGVHRFYTGKTGSGIAMVILTLTIFGAIITPFGP